MNQVLSLVMSLVKTKWVAVYMVKWYKH